MLRSCGHNHRHATGQQSHVGVRDPIGGGDHYLIALVQQSLHEVENRVFGAGGHQNLATLVGQCIVALEFRDNGVLELRRAVDVRVAGEAGADGGDAGLRDVRWGVKIRFSGAEPDNVFAFRLQLRCARRDGEGGGGLDALHARGESDGHFCSVAR